MDVDTGSTTTVVDPVARRQAKIKPGGKTAIYTYTGVVPARTAVTSIILDKYTSKRHPCLLAPINAIAVHAGDDKVLGIVGSDLLRKSAAVLDFGESSLETPDADASPLPATPFRFPMPIEYSDVWGPMLRVRINGHEFMALIDTGCVESIASPDVSAAVNGASMHTADGRPYMVAEKIEFYNPDVGTLEVAPRTFLIGGADRPVYAAEHIRPKVYLGLDLLVYLRARIDFRRNLIYFRGPDAE